MRSFRALVSNAVIRRNWTCVVPPPMDGMVDTVIPGVIESAGMIGSYMPDRTCIRVDGPV
jgi:hypothetical protein